LGDARAKIENYGKNNIIRRSITVTAGYEHGNQYVKRALLEAADKVDKVLAAPKPIVFITDFQNYAVEYTLHYFLREIKRMPWIDADLRVTIFETCIDYGIDLSTPLLSKRFE
jgi:small-conductance mechanosensitive channel